MTTETPNPSTGGGNQPGGATATPQTTTATPAAAGNQPETLTLSKADYDAQMAAAKKDGETRGKNAAQRELDELKAKTMSEEEKKLAEAIKQGETNASKLWSERYLAAKLEAKGFPGDWAKFVEIENVEDSASIEAGIKAAQAKYPWFKAGEAPPPGQLLGTGPAGAAPPKEKWSRTRLRDTSYADQVGKYKAEIAAAFAAGEISPD